MRGGAIEHRRHTEGTGLEDLRGHLQADVQRRRPPAQGHVRPGGAVQRLRPRHPAGPGHAGVRGLHERVHAPVERGVRLLVMDLVPHHRQVRGDAVAREGGHEGRHQIGPPVAGELAGVDQLQGTAGVGMRGGLAVGPGLGGGGDERIRDHRGEHERAPGRLRHEGLQNGAGVLGLGEHHTARGGDLADGLHIDGGRRRGRVAELGDVGPQPTRERAAAGGLGAQVDAAHHHHVRVHPLGELLEDPDGAGAVHLILPRFGAGLVQGDPGERTQARGQHVPALVRLELDVDLGSRGHPGLGHRAQPHGGAVQDVQVDVPVQEHHGALPRSR